MFDEDCCADAECLIEKIKSLDTIFMEHYPCYYDELISKYEVIRIIKEYFNIDKTKV